MKSASLYIAHAQRGFSHLIKYLQKRETLVIGAKFVFSF